MPDTTQTAEAALSRSLESLVIGAPEAFTAREREGYSLAGGDVAQHMQVAVQGQVGRKPLVSELPVLFPMPFIGNIDPGRQEGSLETPVMTNGIELLTQPFVFLSVAVIGWTTGEKESHIGAKLQLMAWVPEAPKRIPFQARVHLTFFGYGAPEEEETS